MPSLLPSAIDRLRKKSRRGFRGYPVATIAWYGPDDRRASKVAVGIVTREDGDADLLERWFSETGDVRRDRTIAEAILAFLRANDVHTVAMSDRIIGCPHEEGIDYPENQACPQCPYWAKRDRFTGKLLAE